MAKKRKTALDRILGYLVRCKTGRTLDKIMSVCDTTYEGTRSAIKKGVRDGLLYQDGRIRIKRSGIYHKTKAAMHYWAPTYSVTDLYRRIREKSR